MKQKMINITIILLLLFVLMIPAMVSLQGNLNSSQMIACTGSQGTGGDC